MEGSSHLDHDKGAGSYRLQESTVFLAKYFERGGSASLVNVWCAVLPGWPFPARCVRHRLLLSVRPKYKMK